MQKYLDKINSPADLKKLGQEETQVLCSEIRELLINSVSKSGGHLAGNLGVVELPLHCTEFLIPQRIKLCGM